MEDNQNQYRFFRRSRNKDGSLRKVRSDKGERRVPLRAEENAPRRTNLLSSTGNRIENGVKLRLEEEKQRLNNSFRGAKRAFTNVFPTDAELEAIREGAEKEGGLKKVVEMGSLGIKVGSSAALLLLATHQLNQKAPLLKEQMSKGVGKLIKPIKARKRLNRMRKNEAALDAADAMIAQAKMKKGGLNLSLRPEELTPRKTARLKAQSAYKLKQKKKKKSKKLDRKRKQFAKQTGMNRVTMDSLLKKARSGDRNAQRALKEQKDKFSRRR